ncbi:hypothetical protein HHI36_014739 [Cryptolaemus montrouzieri]|uniref:Uncharacterized protein n=1 Tax=Cryptolaemus montrouzieri TaxID=559131 RepID=A0ABD2N3H7_9CUCU
MGLEKNSFDPDYQTEMEEIFGEDEKGLRTKNDGLWMRTGNNLSFLTSEKNRISRFPVRKESKHRVQIKLIKPNKSPIRYEDHTLPYTRAGCSSGLNDIASRAVSAMSNFFSNIVSKSNKPKTPADISSTNNVTDENEGNHKTMDDIIKRFKNEALDADDEKFNKLFENLKNELQFACGCISEVNAITKSQTEPENINKGGEDYISRNVDYISKNDLKEMLNEIKLSFERQSCQCDNVCGIKDEDADKCIHNCELLAKYLDNLNRECSCHDKIQGNANSNENYSSQKFKTELDEFQLNMNTVLDRVACKCVSDRNLSLHDKDHSHAKVINTANYFKETDSSVHVDQLITSLETVSCKCISDKELYHHEKNDFINDERIINVVPTDEIKQTDGYVHFDQLNVLVEELKSAIANSACECINNTIARSNIEVSDEIFISHSISNEEGERCMTLIEEAVMNPMELFDLIHSDPTPSTIELESNISSQAKVINSPEESFFSAGCSDYMEDIKNTIENELLLEQGTEIQDSCHCVVDEVVQTFDNMRISYSIFCNEQPKIYPNDREMTKVEFGSKKAREDDVEKIKVRIKFKDERILENKQDSNKTNLIEDIKVVDDIVEEGSNKSYISGASEQSMQPRQETTNTARKSDESYVAESNRRSRHTKESESIEAVKGQLSNLNNLENNESKALYISDTGDQSKQEEEHIEGEESDKLNISNSERRSRHSEETETTKIVKAQRSDRKNIHKSPRSKESYNVQHMESIGAENSKKFINYRSDFNVEYEKTLHRTDELPKIVTEGNIIKIYIPLESSNSHVKYEISQSNKD